MAIRALTFALLLVAGAHAAVNSFIFQAPSGLAINLRGLKFDQNGFKLDFSNNNGFSCFGTNTLACQSGRYFLTSTNPSDITVVSATASQFILELDGGSNEVCQGIHDANPTTGARANRLLRLVVNYDATAPENPQFFSSSEGTGTQQCVYTITVRTKRPIAQRNVPGTPVAYRSFVFVDPATNYKVDLTGLFVSPSNVPEVVGQGTFDYVLDLRSLDGFVCNGQLAYACQSSNFALTNIVDNNYEVEAVIHSTSFTVLLKGGSDSICKDISGARTNRAVRINVIYDATVTDPSGFAFVSETEGLPRCTYNFNVRTNRRVAEVGDDPHFVGLQGERYDVMGEPEQWFNILTDVDTQINAFFHQQTYNAANTTNMQQVGMLIAGHRVFANGTAIYVDDEPLTRSLTFGDKLEIVKVDDKIAKLATPAYIVYLEQKQHYFKETATLAEPFYNVGLTLVDKERNPHGLLGQTAHHKHAKGQSKIFKGHNGEGEIEGTWKQYEVSSAFATDFKYNKYQM